MIEIFATSRPASLKTSSDRPVTARAAFVRAFAALPSDFPPCRSQYGVPHTAVFSQRSADAYRDFLNTTMQTKSVPCESYAPRAAPPTSDPPPAPRHARPTTRTEPRPPQPPPTPPRPTSSHP